MSDLHFLEQLGAEFARLEAHGDGQRSGRRASGGRAPRGALAGLGLVVSVLVVIAVVAVSIGVHGSAPSGSPAPGRTGTSVAFAARAIDPRVGLGPALTRAIPILRARLGRVPGVRISRTADGLVVTAPGGQAARAQIAAVALGVPAQLSVYDWEADVLTGTSKSLVTRLAAQDPAAITISQGVGTAQPGEAGAGGLPLYAAVRLASRQPAVSSTSGLARPGQQYYLFGTPGSVACATAARDLHTAVVPKQPCPLLAGPVTEASTNPAQIDRDLSAALLPGISPSQGVRWVVPQGTVVLQAAPASMPRHTNASAPAAYFALRDQVALASRNITDPQPSTDQSGSPDIQFGFTGTGATAFQRVTAAVARRGQLLSRFQQSRFEPTFNQHFAVAYAGRLITVPQIDFRTYPDGVTGNNGADITGGFTADSAQALVTQLRAGALPVQLSVR
jgi:hypothetical protein